jgi:hypothetical protein
MVWYYTGLFKTISRGEWKGVEVLDTFSILFGLGLGIGSLRHELMIVVFGLVRRFFAILCV